MASGESASVQLSDGLERTMRADARRNHEQLLVSARRLLVARGAAVPLEDIAQAAGVGIATLYRRFPDRPALLRSVAADAMRATVDAASSRPEDPAGALRRFLHTLLDEEVSAVIPIILEELGFDDPALAEERRRAAAAFEALVEPARTSGALLPAVSAGDIGAMLVRLARPLPGSTNHAADLLLAHRHLDLFLKGLLLGVDPPAINRSGPSLTGVNDA